MIKKRIYKNMGKYQRTKGASNEREAACLWHDIGFPFAKRNLNQYQEKDGKDLQNTEPFRVQCKSGVNINPWQALKEAEEEAGKKEIPIAMVKKDRLGWMVIMRWESFKKVINPD
jgi:hypothetical protein